MKEFLLYFFAFSIISCTNAKRSDLNENAAKPDSSGYSQNDIEFMKKADSICLIIDAENHYERIKNGTFVDRDGQEYQTQYKGWSKNSIDSILKFLFNVDLRENHSAKNTFYYYNGTVIKATTEIFGEDTVKSAFYYGTDKIIIYPKEKEMEEAAKYYRERSISLRTFFAPNR